MRFMNFDKLIAVNFGNGDSVSCLNIEYVTNASSRNDFHDKSDSKLIVSLNPWYTLDLLSMFKTS